MPVADEVEASADGTVAGAPTTHRRASRSRAAVGLPPVAVLGAAFAVYLLVSVGLWALRGTLPKDVGARYPKKIAYMSRLPFAEQWRAPRRSSDEGLIPHPPRHASS